MMGDMTDDQGIRCETCGKDDDESNWIVPQVWTDLVFDDGIPCGRCDDIAGLETAFCSWRCLADYAALLAADEEADARVTPDQPEGADL